MSVMLVSAKQQYRRRRCRSTSEQPHEDRQDFFHRIYLHGTENPGCRNQEQPETSDFGTRRKVAGKMRSTANANVD
jgi:hypothetical protein